MSTPSDRFFALVVGIDRFAVHPHLDGCVNDAHAMRDLLVDGFGVPADHIRVLTNEAATRDGIIGAFKSHLIENDAIGRGDAILFHFSGHGANMLDPLDVSPTGLIESLVAYDSGTEGVFGIPDTTVAALLALLGEARGDNVTVVLDCCHSGSGTRSGDGQAPKVRLTRTDERVPPAGLDAEIVGAAKALGGGKMWREGGVPYTLLAACRDRELAQEYVDVSGGKARSQGAFTWHLVDALWKLAPGTSYAMLHEGVAARVNAHNPHQMPQCEGERDRVVFGAARVRRDAFVRVVGVERGELVLDGGQVHGIGVGAQLDLYGASVQRLEELGDGSKAEVLARAVVVSVSPGRCRAVVESAVPEALLHARAVVVDAGEVVPKRGVGVRLGAGVGEGKLGEGKAEERVKAAVAAVVARLADSAWVRFVAEGPAELVVVGEGDRLVVAGADEGRPLVGPWVVGVGAAEEVAERVVMALEGVARFRRVSELGNSDPGSRLQGALRLRLRQVVAGVAPSELPVVEVVEGERVLVYDPAADENLYMLEVVNEGPRAVFVTALLMNADYSILRLYPASGGEQSIDAGRSLFVGHTSANELMDVWLPGDAPGEALWTVSRNSVVVVATVVPVDLALLEQGGLEVPVPEGRHRSEGLEGLIAASVSGHRMARKRSRAGEDWGAASLAYTVVRKPESVVVGGG